MYQMVADIALHEIIMFKQKNGSSTSLSLYFPSEGEHDESRSNAERLLCEFSSFHSILEERSEMVSKINHLSELNDYYIKGMMLKSLAKRDSIVLNDRECCQLTCAFLHNRGIPIEEIYIGRVIFESEMKKIVTHEFCLLSKVTPTYKKLSDLDRVVRGDASLVVDTPWVVDGFFEKTCHYHQYTWHLKDACRKLARSGNKRVSNILTLKGRKNPLTIHYFDFYLKLMTSPVIFQRVTG